MVGFPLETAPTRNTIGFSGSSSFTKLKMSIIFPLVDKAILRD